MNKIPKIIHQLAPKNKKIWHPIWNRCQKSWFSKFKKFKYIMWTDEKIDSFIKKNYPKHFNLLNSCPLHIIKLDIVRYMILYRYGGIYVDMDVYCYENFFGDIKKNIYLNESISKKEVVQNSLMMCKKNHLFFKKCIELSLIRLKKTNLNILIKNYKKTNNKSKIDKSILYIGGPLLLSFLYKKYKDFFKIPLLSNNYFNVHYLNNSKNIKTKHMLTGFWGKNTIEELKKIKKDLKFKMSQKQFFLLNYLHHRNINAKTFVF
jgi:mannosyltransferase OCH1-like enzyme